MAEGCANAARWQVGFRLWALAMPRQQRNLSNCLNAKTGLCVCDEHKGGVKGPSEFPPASKERIAAALQKQGYLIPDFVHGVLTFDEIIGEPVDVERMIPPGVKVTEG